MLSAARKRGREDDEELSFAVQPSGKRTRPSDSYDAVSTLSNQPLPVNGHELYLTSTHPDGDDGSPRSNASEMGDTSDQDMDLDPVRSQSPPQDTVWSIKPAMTRPTVRSSAFHPSSRVPTPIVTNGPIRPKPAPLQTTNIQDSSSPSRYRTKATESVPRSTMTMMTDRLPSPIDEDEPHTPTTAAGSQLSLLSVSDMDVDNDVATPGPNDLDSVVVRKQRQRSGAFISTPDAARKFSMGYRDDCEKCRNRVPGHMNHFLGPS